MIDFDYKIIDEQIKLLKNKELKFKNESFARKVILRENYYHLISYDSVFVNLKKGNYEIETYFEELYAIYNFDRELRNLMFNYINILEANIKSFIAYLLSEKYKCSDFLCEKNFKSGERFATLKKQINENLQREFNDSKSNIKKYNDEHGYLPPLLLIKVFTFGNIAALYSIMKKEDRKTIADNFNITSAELNDYLKVLNIVRNICAHGDILFNLKLNKDTYFNDYKYHRLLKIKKTNGKYQCGVNDLFSVLIIFKSLLCNEDFYQLFIKIENLLINVRNEIDDLSYHNLLKLMGMPDNFHDLYQTEVIKYAIYNPSPVDTSNINLNEDNIKLAETIAKNNHDIWGLKRKNEGWKYGTVRDDKLKTNPCFIPYENLSKTEKEYDFVTAIETLKLIEKLGYIIIKEEK